MECLSVCGLKMRADHTDDNPAHRKSPPDNLAGFVLNIWLPSVPQTLFYLIKQHHEVAVDRRAGRRLGDVYRNQCRCDRWPRCRLGHVDGHQCGRTGWPCGRSGHINHTGAGWLRTRNRCRTLQTAHHYPQQHPQHHYPQHHRSPHDASRKISPNPSPHTASVNAWPNACLTRSTPTWTAHRKSMNPQPSRPMPQLSHAPLCHATPEYDHTETLPASHESPQACRKST